jgi:hypothetical protein
VPQAPGGRLAAIAGKEKPVGAACLAVHEDFSAPQSRSSSSSARPRPRGWDGTRLDGTQGARTWVGCGVLAHNLVEISALAT